MSSRKGWVGVWSSKRTYEVEMCPLASPQQLMMLSAERRQQGAQRSPGMTVTGPSVHRLQDTRAKNIPPISEIPRSS